MSNKEKKLPKWLKAVLIAAPVFVLLLIFLSGSNDDITETTETTENASYSVNVTTAQKEPEAVKVSAITLIADYKENEAAANKIYKDNKLIVSDAIVYSTNDNYVELECTDDDYWLEYIDAYYNSEQSNTVYSLKKGDKIIVVGECIGLSTWSKIKLRNCSFEIQ